MELEKPANGPMHKKGITLPLLAAISHQQVLTKGV